MWRSCLRDTCILDGWAIPLRKISRYRVLERETPQVYCHPFVYSYRRISLPCSFRESWCSASSYGFRRTFNLSWLRVSSCAGMVIGDFRQIQAQYCDTNSARGRSVRIAPALFQAPAPEYFSSPIWRFSPLIMDYQVGLSGGLVLQVLAICAPQLSTPSWPALSISMSILLPVSTMKLLRMVILGRMPTRPWLFSILMQSTLAQIFITPRMHMSLRLFARIRCFQVLRRQSSIRCQLQYPQKDPFRAVG